MNITEIINKRCLLKIGAGYGTKLDEFKVIEISPSGNWIKLMNLHGSKFWKPVTEI